MRRTNPMLILALLLVAAGAIFILLEKDDTNSIEIPRDDAAHNDIEPITDDTEEEPEEDEAPAEIPAADLTWAIERYAGKEIIKVSTTEKAVALTFDAGANADGVDKVLSILAASDIKGTFFLTGKFIEKYPDKVKAIVASGGDIGNHTYDHPYLTGLTSERIGEEIRSAELALEEGAAAEFRPLLRSPYGDRNQSTMKSVSDNGYINIRWTVDSLGWKGTSGGQTKDTVRDKVLKASSPGAIIMMHLGSNPDDKTHLDSQALPEIIAQLKADGYEFMTLSELIELEK